ncbi:MAG TPA: CoA transferase [Burkholderiales bacterium]|nr:CoA transferase [Burkholderiales bacterium]
MNNDRIDAQAQSRGRALPLADVVVLDFTHVIAGPFAAMALADLGATVLKIETPGRGDTARGTPPHEDGSSHFFAAVNRNKYSIAVNLKTVEGKALLHKLVKKADVVLHNFRPGVMESLGLGYEDLIAARPELVYCAISGFGQDGPLRDKPAFDGVIQAMAGLMSLTGEAGRAPVRAGLSVGDYIPGLYAAMAIIAALRDRDRTGDGQYIDVSNFDCLFNIMGYYFPYYELTGKVPERNGGAHPTVVPMGGFPTKDGHMVVAAFNQGFWRNLCRALGKLEWLEDPRFERISTRAKHSKILFEELSAALREKTTAEWERIFEEHDVPSGPVLDVADLVEHPQVKHRKLLGGLGRGRMRAPMRPVKYRSFEQEVRLAPPELGEDTVQILRKFGCLAGDDEIESLVRSGVIEDPAYRLGKDGAASDEEA